MEHQAAIQLVQKELGSKAAELFQKLLSQKPQRADAIIWLQGDRLDRLQTAVNLYEQDLSKTIVLSGNNNIAERKIKHGENDMCLDELVDELTSYGVPKEHIMLDEQSLSTHDQAVHVLRLAKQQRWKSLLVLTSPYHVLRAYLTFLKQVEEQRWNGQLSFYAAGPAWHKYPSGRSETVLEMLGIELDKIERYQSQLVSFEFGLLAYNT